MEEWKSIKGYEGLYEISNLGNVKSLSRIILKSGKYNFTTKEQILKKQINLYGYSQVNLHLNGKKTTRSVHQLVAIAFLNHTPCGFKLVVNHKNFIRTDNRLENLELITQRENANQKHLSSSSKYTGVSWFKKENVWMSHIVINGKLKYLGSFKNEIDASNAYQNKLKTIL